MRLDQITVYRIVYRCVLAQDERTLLYRSCSCSLCCRFWLRRKKTGGERERDPEPLRLISGGISPSPAVSPFSSRRRRHPVNNSIRVYFLIFLFFTPGQCIMVVLLSISYAWYALWCRANGRLGRLSVSLLFFASACVFSTKAQLLFPTDSFAHRAQGALIHWRSLSLLALASPSPIVYRLNVYNTNSWFKIHTHTHQPVSPLRVCIDLWKGLSGTLGG